MGPEVCVSVCLSPVTPVWEDAVEDERNVNNFLLEMEEQTVKVKWSKFTDHNVSP